jgi:site-specific recombinase XerD
MPVIIRERRHPSGHISLTLDITSGGKRSREALGLILTGDKHKDRETRRLAEEIRVKREYELNSNIYSVGSTNTLRLSFYAYAETVLEGKYSLGTQQTYRRALQHLRDFDRDSELRFKAMTATYLRGFHRYLLQRVSESSAAAYFFKIMSILRHALADGIIPSLPRVQIKTPAKIRTIKYLELHEIQALARTECSNKNIRNAFLFSCFSGLRYSDLVALRWDNMKDAQLSIIQKKTQELLFVDMGKAALKILEKQSTVLKSDKSAREHVEGTVFYLPRQSTVDKALKKWARDAGLNRTISMHTARHTFGTLAVSCGIDILTVSKLMGHTSIETTLIYAKLIDPVRKMAVEKLPTLDL